MGEGGIVNHGQIATRVVKEVWAITEHEGRASAILEASIDYYLRRAAVNNGLRGGC